MKRLNRMTMLLWGVLSLLSCNNKSNAPLENKDTILAYDEKIKHGVIEMDRFHITDSVNYKGHVYVYDIVRIPDSTLAKVVEQETQTQYMDNHIELSIYKDGAVLYEKVFTKNDFDQYLDAGFKVNGILEGFVYDDKTDDGLRFATSVSYPQSDMYIPLTVTVRPNGSIIVSKENFLEQHLEEDGD